MRRKRLIASAGAVTAGTAMSVSGLAAAVPAVAAPAHPAVPEEHVRAYAPSEQAVASHKAYVTLAAQPRMITVRSGDTLWGLSKKFLGSGSKWPKLYAANKCVVGPDPNVIVPGERLQLSASPSFGGNAPVAVPATPSAPSMSETSDGLAQPPAPHHQASHHHHQASVVVKGTVTAGSLTQLASVLSGMGYDGAALANIAQFLHAHGYSAAGAAGVDACIAGESAGNPESVGSGGFGLIGWTGNTIGLPAGYAGPVGNQATDLAAQEQGILGYNSAVGDVAALNSQSGPSAAAAYYSNNFEKPQVPGSDIRDAVGQAVFSALGG